MATGLNNKYRRVAGGAATAGGINFQAAVTAIVSVYMARGQRLSWLSGLIQDIPVAVNAETGGPGDDIRIEFGNNVIAELQVKKGLRKGKELWESLIKIARAVDSGIIQYGLLIVSPGSSNTIKEGLERDIRRLGEGRHDHLSQIATEFIKKLQDEGLPVEKCCKRIRIQTVNAVDGDEAHILAVKSELCHICSDHGQIAAAWHALSADASRMIEHRGRRDVSSVIGVLNANLIAILETDVTRPVLLLNKLSRWTYAVNEHFTIFGVKKPFRIDEAWIPIRAVVQEDSSDFDDLSAAIEHYLGWSERSVDRDAKIVDPETLARFIPWVVLIGGPGMGKTTLLKMIARRYSEDNIPILKVSLRSVARRTQGGEGFVEALYTLALDGSGISAEAARAANFHNLLLLCDGLDECGVQQEVIADGIFRFAAGHAGCRIIITTRPVGYTTAKFRDWRHYEIAPLNDNTSSIPNQLATLILEATPEGAALHESCYDVCRDELENVEAHAIISKSPLLLGLAASILVRGGKLGKTKSSIYEQVFSLLDDTPNPRVPNKPLSSTYLQHFLNSLGWCLTARPLSRVNDIIESCAQDIVRATDIKPLAAQAQAEQLVEYWQNVGIIERLGAGLDETIVFIHKSFGEYAAARHLLSMSPDECRDTLGKIVGDKEWMEVLRFAANLGLANQICEVLTLSDSFSQRDADCVAFAMELVATATPSPKGEVLQVIIQRAKDSILSDRRAVAAKVGGMFVQAAARFPEQIGPLAATLLTHEQSWTSLYGWAAAVAAGPDYYPYEKLHEAMRYHMEKEGYGTRRRLGGGLTFYDTGQEILRAFIVSAASVVLEDTPSVENDGFIIEVLKRSEGNSVYFMEGLITMLQSKGRSDLVERMYGRAEANKSTLMSSQIAALMSNSMLLDMVEALSRSLQSENVQQCSLQKSKKLLEFSAFVCASGMLKLPYSYIVWDDSFDDSAVQEVLRGFVGIAGLNAESLAEQTNQALSFMHESETNSIFRLITDVDFTPLDWGRALKLNLDGSNIEKALYHPFYTIVWLAANLLYHSLPESELEHVSKRLLQNGNEHSFWAASNLLGALGHEQAVDILVGRLSEPLVPGCTYLFEALRHYDLQWSLSLGIALRNGLEHEVLTAIEAAKLAVHIAEPELNELEAIVVESYEYWVQHEEPYPQNGGTIPDSPRVLLLEAISKIKKVSYGELKTYAQDSRNDVSSFAENKIVELLSLQDAMTTEFLNDILLEELPARMLRDAVKKMSPLNSSEVAICEEMLRAENATIRYHAMSLLEADSIECSVARSLVQSMANDSKQEIRERAFRIIESL